MKIFKTKTKATYFKGMFQLRNNTVNNWATPIEFPTVFTAYGASIKSGNWQSCTAINTPQYVIDNYFRGKTVGLVLFWEAVFNLEKITWEDVKKNKEHVLKLIHKANKQLLNLEQL